MHESKIFAVEMENGSTVVSTSNEMLIEAARNGNAAEVRRLIPLIAVSNPKDNHSSYALVVAAFSGHSECVQLLIPVCNPKYNDSNALRMAAKNGHAKCVELLIPVSKPKAGDSWGHH